MTTPQDMMQIGQALVEHCQNGKEAELMQNYYSPDAISAEAVEMPGMGREVKGLEAIIAKGEWWMNAHEIHSSSVEGPFVHGNSQFSVIFDMDVTEKASGTRTQMREIGTYHVENGKIVREEFSYAVGE
ncbi:MAG: nuclear transport factor 2 family protein [Pseudomonadota bacterium]